MVMPTAPTPYPEVNALLSELLDGARTILGRQFVGMMLYGSLAGGYFDAASDVDVLVITDADISSDTLTALAAMHERMALSESPWAIQLEISYIPLAALRRYDPDQATHPHLDRGPRERLHWMKHDVDWIVQRYVLRERGVVVAGPPPANLIDPVSPAELRGAMRPLLERRERSLRDDPNQLNFRGYQSYVVLSVCRSLYTLKHGTIVPKPAAARWALVTCDEQWRGLIERALEGRQEPGGEVLAGDTDGTLAFIRYALER